MEVSVDGKPVTVVMISKSDIDGLRELTSHVFKVSENKPLELEDGRIVTAVVPISPYSSCKVEYVPRGQNKLQWTEGQWLGGYHSPCHSEVFDLLGRQIEPGPLSPTGFPKVVGNLPFPKIRQLSETRIEVAL